MSGAGDGMRDPARLLRRPSRRRGDANAWMVTFTDLVALMLTFFVMLFAMSTVQIEKWHNLTDALRQSLNSVLDVPRASPRLRLDMPARDVRAGADLDYVAELMRGQLASVDALAGSVVRREQDRLFVLLPSGILFATGEVALTGDARRAVFALGGVLQNLPNRIEVAGHADPRRPGRRYRSNWELSLLRAHAVAAAVRGAGYEGPITARGHGDSRYDSLPRDLQGEVRQALARRVDIVVHESAREAR